MWYKVVGVSLLLPLFGCALHSATRHAVALGKRSLLKGRRMRIVQLWLVGLVFLIPFVLVRKKIKSVYVLSFLYYVPYAVLGAMTFPAIFTSTGSIVSAVVGCVVAVFLAFKEKSLLTVALTACGAVLVVELLQMYVF